MFISIPKEFFVPVVFGTDFVLNNETDNLEFDTEYYRESTAKKISEKEVVDNNSEKVIVVKEKEGSIVNIGEKTGISNNVTDNINKKVLVESTNTEMGFGIVKEKTVNNKTLYMELNDAVEKGACRSNVENIFNDIDDEYVDSIE